MTRTEPVAARADGVWKVHGSGAAEVTALTRGERGARQGPVHGHRGPVRVRQVDADALPRRAPLRRLADGAVVDELADPTADAVLDTMKRLDVRATK